MSVLKKCPLLVVAAGMVFVILVPGSPPGQAAPGAAPLPAASPTGKENKTNGSFGRAKDKDGSVTITGRKESSQPGKSVESGKSSSGSSDSTSGYGFCSSSPVAAATPGTPRRGRALDSFGRSLDEEDRICAIRPSSSPVPGGADPKVVAQQAVATLTLPDVSPVIQPDPEWNQWKSYAVGEDLWLWADSPAQLSTTVTQQGITIQITAVRDKIDFDMGDGGVDSIVSCKEMTKYEPPPMYHTGPWESPTCRYYYKKLPEQRCAGYTMTATAHWTVTWSVLGQSGTIPMKKTQTKHLPIVELHALAVSTRDPYDPYDPNNDPYGDPNDPMNSQAACPRPGTTTPSQAGTPSQAPTSTPAPTSKPTQTRKPGSKPS